MEKAGFKVPLPDDANDLDMATVLDALLPARDAMLGILNQSRRSDLASKIIQSEIERFDDMVELTLDRLMSMSAFDDFRHECTIATAMTAMAGQGFSAVDMLACFSTMMANVTPSLSADSARSAA